jgi:hypothetical protein
VEPPSSEARGEEPADPEACLDADVPGTYVVHLTATECGDAGLRSPPARFEFQALPGG